ncbi:MAG: S1 RNA-binding domain-containing protein [Myxococcota bacterium]
MTPQPPRRRPKGARPAPQAQTPAGADPSADAPVEGRHGAYRRAEHPEDHRPPKPREPQRERAFDPDDLMALAQMDPAELAALMEGSVGQRSVKPGTRVEGTVTRVGDDVVFVDVGAKSEGQIERGELKEVAVGDRIQAFVVADDELGIQLSTSLSGQAASEHLDEARETGTPVEGKVTRRNSGGFEVRIGSVRAFCPISRISRLPEVDLDAYLGQTLPFRVVETGEKVVVDRRVLQEEEAATKADELWGRLAEGQQHRGIIRSVQPFGMFVDIGGVDGLVPKREISWASVDDPRTVVKQGQAVEVVILEIDHEHRKLTLSARALEDDPWTSLGLQFHEGGVYPGTVVRAEPYGVFVELTPGLTGLVHVSKLPGGAPAVGTALDVRLLAIDLERRRLELSPVREGGAAEGQPAAEVRVRGTVADVMRNGVVVQLDDGRTGWLPENEVDLPGGTVLAQRFRQGRTVEARVVQDDPRRPTLSMRANTEAEERSWQQHRAGGRGASSGGSFGTLGDLLGGLNLKK